MGALGQHFDELETKHKLEETELTIIKGRYESLCGKVKTNANEKRNSVDHNDFLRNYGKEKGFYER